jgi:hypothetical protein
MELSVAGWITISIGVLSLFLTAVIALNNALNLKDRLRRSARRALGVSTVEDEIRKRKIENDRELLQRIRNLLSRNEAITILREHSFGDAFRDNLTDPMHQILWESREPEFEFHDNELEETKTSLIDAIDRFTNTVASETWHEEKSTEWRRVPKEWQWKQKDRLRRVVGELNEAADEIVQTYDDLVRKGRAKFGD